MSPTELAESIREAAAANTQPSPEAVQEAQPEPVGDFRANLLRMADLADQTVQEGRRLRAENAHLAARHEQEVKAHARTAEMLKAAEGTNLELRTKLDELREINIRLNAHMESMGNNLLSAAREGK